MIHNRFFRFGRFSEAYRRFFVLMFFLALVGIPGLGFAQDSASAAEQVETCPPPSTEKRDPSSDPVLAPDPNLVVGRLENGFRYILMPNHRPENRVSLHLYVNAGSLNETDSQQGAAHFLEHMLFNGSTHFPPGKLIHYLQGIGMQLGNDANARTGFDQTVYDIILPGGDAENLQNGLLVMFDYAAGALLLEDEIDQERGVVLSEMRSRDSASYRTFEAELPFRFPGFLLANRLPIGKAEVLRHMDRGALKSFYDTWYRPDNMTLVMVGPMDIPTAEWLIQARFMSLAPRTPAVDPPDPGTFHHQGVKIFYHPEPEAGETTIRIETLRHEPPVVDSVQVRYREVVAAMADEILQNRLDTLVKTQAAPFTSAATNSGVYLGQVRYSQIVAGGNAEKWQSSLSTIEQELRRALTHGFVESELERVRKNTLKHLDNAVREAPTRNSTPLAKRIIRYLSENRVIQSPEQEKALLSPLVESVTLEEIQTAFSDTWSADHRLILVTGNLQLASSVSDPPEKQIQSIFEASQNVDVPPPISTESRSFPYLPEPNDDPGRVISRKTISDLGITQILLKNGVRVNLKPTVYKTNEVMANLVFGGGRATEPASLPGLGPLTQPTVDESGLGAMDADTLERALAGKSTYVDLRIREGAFDFFVESVSSEVELMVQLLYAHVVDPGFREDALERAREWLRQDYRSSSRSIEGMMKIEGFKYLAGGDARFGMPDERAMDAISLPDIRNWLTTQLDLGPLELSVVGDFDLETVIVQVRKYLGALPKRKTNAPAMDPSRLPMMPVGKGVHHISVETQIPKALVVAAWKSEDYWDIGRTRRLSVLADIFSERLRKQIRETLGATYSPYAYNRPSRAYPEYGVFQAHTTVSPDQSEAVLAAIRDIALDLSENGVTPNECRRAIQPILTSIRETRHTNGYWLNSVMIGSGQFPQQLEWARDFLEDYEAITSAELSRLASMYLVPQRATALVIAPIGAPEISQEKAESNDRGADL
ncbi:insulinase family protein [Desulfosarcina sp. OttesenSCG-928-A07]|nr:insulinase family protein [Desulfosarcina sp. OttesenSCG-928-G17]MDL2328699.1 insulinase family protein [Desulfosarcina sp. OttesenSCG-928-A07]